MFKNLGPLHFGEIGIGSGRLFVDLPGLSWNLPPGLIGQGGRGHPDNLGLILALKEQLMYALSSSVFKNSFLSTPFLLIIENK